MNQYEESDLYMYPPGTTWSLAAVLAWTTHGQIKYQRLSSVNENRMLPTLTLNDIERDWHSLKDAFSKLLKALPYQTSGRLVWRPKILALMTILFE